MPEYENWAMGQSDDSFGDGTNHQMFETCVAMRRKDDQFRTHPLCICCNLGSWVSFEDDEGCPLIGWTGEGFRKQLLLMLPTASLIDVRRNGPDNGRGQNMDEVQARSIVYHRAGSLCRLDGMGGKIDRYNHGLLG
jgi:hypothetical protein